MVHTFYHQSSDNTPSGQSVAQLLEGALKEVRSRAMEGGLLYVYISDLPLIIRSFGITFAEQLLSELYLNIRDTMLKKTDHIVQSDRDHFSIVLTDYSLTEMEKKADELFHHIINYGCLHSTKPVQLTAVIGSASFSELTDTPEDIVNKAYVALSDAISAHTHYHLFTGNRAHNNQSSQQMVLANYLQSAFLTNRLALAFQPIVNATTGDVVFYEALLRIINENGEPISVGPFIEVVEDMGFIDVIDGVSLKLAIQELQLYPDLVLSVNISSQTIQQPKWIAMVASLLKGTKVASRIIFEITETAEQTNPGRIIYSATILKQLGCRIALDDFGSGNTSFSQLRDLPIDILKIDGSLIRNLKSNAQNRALVETLIQLGQKIGFKVLAEYVESLELLELLKELGMHYLQGNYLAKATMHKPWTDQNPGV